MKLLLKDVIPGMVIETDRGTLFVVYNKKEGKIDSFFGEKAFLEYFDVESCEMGRMLHEYTSDEKVKLLTGQKREDVIKRILKETRIRRTNVERDLEMLDILITLTKP